jgi:two-component system chemotaxis response regulator CheB
MPDMDGFEATKRIMRDTPTPIVIVSGQQDVHQVAGSMNALKMGALAVLPKPYGPASPGFEAQCRNITQTVKLMSDVKVIRHRDLARRPTPVAPILEQLATRLRAVAIAASTGGPEALYKILTRLPTPFPAPILVVQHIAPNFVNGFAAWLNTAGNLTVKIAAHGEVLKPACVYLAPDDRHIGLLDATRLTVSGAPPIGGFRPSATFLFDSAARALGRGLVAVQLTGMGRDGVEGLRVVRAGGGRVIAQDEASSVVYGMPGEAVAAGVVDQVLPLESIAEQIGRLIQPRDPMEEGL